jgi:hypothetical protein
MKTILSICFALAASLIALTSNAFAAEHPNVVIVISEDQGYGDLGCTGNRSLRMPPKLALLLNWKRELIDWRLSSKSQKVNWELTTLSLPVSIKTVHFPQRFFRFRTNLLRKV